MLVILTGQAGVGKSTLLAKINLNPSHKIEADAHIKKYFYVPGHPVYERIKAQWGTKVLTKEHQINYQALGTIVFNDEKEMARLDGFVLPDLRAWLTTLKEASALYVVELATYLKLEKKLRNVIDKVVLIEREVPDLTHKFNYLANKSQPLEKASIKSDLVIKNDGLISAAQAKLTRYLKPFFEAQADVSKILVVNAGSSTIKWKLFDLTYQLLAEGVADRIFVDGVITTHFNGEKFVQKLALSSHEVATEAIVKDMLARGVISSVKEVTSIGNRIVQGGQSFFDAIKLTEANIKKIASYASLAPLHNPPAVATIRALQKHFAHAQMSASFDTAFHTSIPELFYTYPINAAFAKKWKIRKYGMHGISYQFVTEAMVQKLGRPVNLIIAHIGNGASLAAIKNSRSYNTSMGLTPLAGVMMGTRSGDIDPSIHQYVVDNAKLTLTEFTTMLTKESGLKGVSGLSNDMRDVIAAAQKGHAQAAFSVELYAQRIADFVATYLAQLDGQVDGIVFTAGVGENSPIIRQKVIDRLKFVNIYLGEINSKPPRDEVITLISTPQSQIPVYIAYTNEELMIARDATRKDL